MPSKTNFVKGLDKIIILAQGPSWYQIPHEKPKNCEVWGSNSIYRDYNKVDRLFIAHDIRVIMMHDDGEFVEHINKLGIPVYTHQRYKVLKNNAIIPIVDLMNEFGQAFFLNVITYMIAVAIMQKPKTIQLFGVDMRPDAGNETYSNEKGSVEYWLGVAIGRGIEIINTKESFVLKTKQEGNFEGYKEKVPQDGLAARLPKHERTQQGIQNYILMPVDTEI